MYPIDRRRDTISSSLPRHSARCGASLVCYWSCAFRKVALPRTQCNKPVPIRRLLPDRRVTLTCSPDCYHSEVESGSFMIVG